MHTNSRTLIFFFAVFPLLYPACISQKSVTGEKKLIRQYQGSTFFDSHFSGIVLKDLRSGETLLNVNGDKLFTPASNVKLITFYVTDNLFEDSIPTLTYCEWNDTTYFSGMGDPSFLHPLYDHQPAFDALKKSPFPLAYSPTPIADERYGPGWAWDDFPFYFQPEKSTMPLYGNSLWIKKEKEYEPEIFPDLFEVNVRVDTSFIKLKTSRNELENIFALSYDELPEEINESVPFRTNDSVTVSLLEDTLHRNIIVKDLPVFCQSRILYSQPKDSLFSRLLVESDNFIAEQLLLSASALVSDTLNSERLIDHAMDEYFFNWKDKISWRDGSGLSRYNMLSPSFLMDLLEKIYAENDWQRIVALFPDAGKEGTLKHFLQSSGTFVYAKTGSMTGVYNLSGYLITEKGNLLAFSAMNNNFKSSFREVKAELEKFLLSVKKKY